MSEPIPKRTGSGFRIGHDAVRVAFEHERASWRDLTTETYIGAGTHKRLDKYSVEYDHAKERWQKAAAFADWIVAAYQKQQGDQS